MSTFKNGIVSKEFVLLNRVPAIGKILIFFSILSLFLYIPAFSQCPAITKNNTNISVEQGKNEITLTTGLQINFSTARILLYDFDKNAYCFDSRRMEKVSPDLNIKVRTNTNEINVRDLPSGDFAIVVEFPGCKRQALGLDYSGFPYSAIKVQ